MSSPKKIKLNDFLDLCNSKDNDNTCMVTFQFEDEEKFRVHSCELAAVNTVFHKMFFGPMKEKKDVITITNISANSFKSLVRYLITSVEEITEENAVELLHVAKMYLVTNLTHNCEKFLGLNLKISNVVEMLNISLLCDCYILREKIFEFIIKNQRTLVESECFNSCTDKTLEYLLMSPFLALPEDDILQMLENWADSEIQLSEFSCEECPRNIVMKKLLKHINIFHLSEQSCQSLLISKHCSAEAYEDIKDFRRNRDHLFIPRYFSAFERQNIGNALRYINIWFNDTETEPKTILSVWTNKHVKFKICALYFFIKRNIDITISVSEDGSPKPDKSYSLYLGPMEKGCYVCFIPDHFTYSDRKCTFELEYEDNSSWNKREDREWEQFSQWIKFDSISKVKSTMSSTNVTCSNICSIEHTLSKRYYNSLLSIFGFGLILE